MEGLAPFSGEKLIFFRDRFSQLMTRKNLIPHAGRFSSDSFVSDSASGCGQVRCFVIDAMWLKNGVGYVFEFKVETVVAVESRIVMSCVQTFSSCSGESCGP